MHAEELTRLDATAQAALVHEGRATPEELVAAAIGRIERFAALNAVVHVRREAVQESKSVPRTAPLAGVPVLLKDLSTELAGGPLTNGSRFLQGCVGAEDAEFVRRLKAAGAVIVGRTHSSEFGLLPTAETLLFGSTRNPWDLTRTPGGSSGGAAAAVAARLVPAAHGNDGGGSLRIPAACCGVVALNPTRGRAPWGPRYGDYLGGLAREGMITRSVRDTALFLDVTSGPAADDLDSALPLRRRFVEELRRPPERLQIGFGDVGWPLSEEARAALKETVWLCRQLGHDVFEADTPKEERSAFSDQIALVRAVECSWQIDSWARRLGRAPSPDCLEPLTWRFYKQGRDVPASDYLLAWEDLQRWSRRVAGVFERMDVFLTPATTAPAPTLGHFQCSSTDDALRRAREFSPFTMASSLTGQPAVALPLFWASSGLPVGVQFVGRLGEEAVLLRLAAQLESARPWEDRRPPSLDQMALPQPR